MATPLPLSPQPVRALAALFATVGATAFGGGVSAHLMSVFVRRGWLTEPQFLEALNWCQNLPGPNATNQAAYLGYRFAGPWGAWVSVFGLVTPGAVVVLLAARCLDRVPPAVAHGALNAVAAAAVGLLMGMVGRLLLTLGRPARWLAAGATLGLVVFVGVPTPFAIVLMLPLLWRSGKAAA